MDTKPKKSLGQNFLINQGILDKIVSAGELTPNDTVLEIGPGTGNLTKLLSEKILQSNSIQTGRVIAVEKDHRLIAELQEKFKNTNVEIIEGDIWKLKFENLKLTVGEYKIVANIPYYITSHLLKTIFESDDWRATKPKLIVLTVQKEVAQRIVAKPPDMNLLALSVQLYAEPKIISYISRGSFRPMPNVDSAIIKLIPHPNTEAEKILSIAKIAFAGKRKQLRNTLKQILPDIEEILNQTDIGPNARPEELSVEDWIKVCSFLS